MMSLLVLHLLLLLLRSLLLLHSVRPTTPMENKRVVRTRQVRQTGGSTPATAQGREPYAGRSKKDPPRAGSDSGSPAQAGGNG